ncbi:hypothetical protein K458DRAFT_319893 [Lentithecium fluviatile CBS 122367]|uniref:Chromatin modification-related protein n=1 Tax=Lentithecium fluviatile CBS 122367 TaxID=1168545 RepID=A0A6G1IGT7_9PLEO|nr:hypothetical protein K458DRAFT_319893 [Lentithecium fluviatile CBS 122367]
MAIPPEDPAAVLEQFIHDVANLPAEITHLYEEVQAKDALIQEARNMINSRDSSLQKFIKLNGPLVQNPKEEPYSKIILQNYEKAQILQEEKIGLVEKAAALMDRHVKRLDIKLRDLQNEGSIPTDLQMPSLLRDSPGNMVPPSSLATTGANTPLQSVSGNHAGPGGPNLAHAAIARISNAANMSRGNPSIQNMTAQALLNQQRLANQQSVAQATARQEREMSASSDSKRRRPNLNTGPLPTPGRQSSLGPGTPKPSTPGSRAGSVGPRPQKHPLTVKKAKLQQPLRKAALTAKAGANKKRRKGGSRASPSTTNDDESVASEAGTEDEEMSGMGGEGEEDESDDTKYCTCQRVSFGDMVACDNDDCKYQWFHWECVGIKEEPVGDWLCPDCRKQPATKIKRAR